MRTAAALGAALVLVTCLAGCGRRGALLPPPDPSAPAADSTANKAGIHRRPKNPPIVPPNDSFVLDPIL